VWKPQRVYVVGCAFVAYGPLVSSIDVTEAETRGNFLAHLEQ